MNIIHGNLTLQIIGDVDSGTLQKHGPCKVQVESSQISWIRCLGAMQAQPYLQGCTGVAWDVTDVGAGHSFEQLGWQGQLGLGSSGLPVLQVQ